MMIIHEEKKLKQMPLTWIIRAKSESCAMKYLGTPKKESKYLYEKNFFLKKKYSMFLFMLFMT